MDTKYFNDALVGNEKIKASFTNKGELIRLLYEQADYKQFLDIFHTGLKINDSALVYLHNDVNNLYNQKYIENTNILQTQIFNTYFKIKITQTDFAPINENFLVKNYVIKNENNIDLNINFLVYSKILTNLNNDTCGYINNNSLIQYNHDFSICTFSNSKLYSKQVNGASNNFMNGEIGGKDYIGMSCDSAISYDLNCLEPNQEIKFTLFVYINKNKEKNIFVDLCDEIERIKNINIDLVLDETRKYWNNFVSHHDILQFNKKEISEQIKKIYNRSILLFSLLVNSKTGGISAGIEVDENKTKCGRYSYCWPRDAVFITKALDIVGMKEISDKFYSQFCKMTQSKNGMWEQRFYTDGRLAPCWGYQIDETASVIFGAYEHYKFTKEKKFLKDNLDMLEKAITFLETYVQNVLENKDNMQKSYDLWEEFEGISLYSLSAIHGAFDSMIKIYEELNGELDEKSNEDQNKKQEIKNIQILMSKIKEYCEIEFYDEERKSYIRNKVDKKIDISLVGITVPFVMFEKEETKVKNTIEKINLTIKTQTDGYLRYESDSYMGGKYPWPIASLWMAWYYLEIGNRQKALEIFEFVTKSASEHGFLGEQVDNQSMKPAWVIGLTWSHAMYLIILTKLSN